LTPLIVIYEASEEVKSVGTEIMSQQPNVHVDQLFHGFDEFLYEDDNSCDDVIYPDGREDSKSTKRDATSDSRSLSNEPNHCTTTLNAVDTANKDKKRTHEDDEAATKIVKRKIENATSDTQTARIGADLSARKRPVCSIKPRLVASSVRDTMQPPATLPKPLPAHATIAVRPSTLPGPASVAKFVSVASSDIVGSDEDILQKTLGLSAPRKIAPAVKKPLAKVLTAARSPTTSKLDSAMPSAAVAKPHVADEPTSTSRAAPAKKPAATRKTAAKSTKNPKQAVNKKFAKSVGVKVSKLTKVSSDSLGLTSSMATKLSQAQLAARTATQSKAAE
jgi:hypothetical protein